MKYFVFIVFVLYSCIEYNKIEYGCYEGDLECSEDRNYIYRCSREGIWEIHHDCSDYGFYCCEPKERKFTCEPLNTCPNYVELEVPSDGG